MDWKANPSGSIPNSFLSNIDWHMDTWREGLLGATYARQDKTDQAHAQIEKLEPFRPSFPGTLTRMQKGLVSYWQARIHAVLGEKEQAVTRLAQSLRRPSYRI